MTFNPSPAVASRRGSAFLIALVVLSILTVIGLSLVLVTETEMLLGGTERVAGESHEATEAILATGLAKLVVTNALDDRTLYMSSSYDKNRSEQQDTSGTAESTHIGYELRSSGLSPVGFQKLPYSSEGLGENTFWGGYLFGSFRSLRLGWDGNELVPPGGCTDVEILGTTSYQMTGFYYGPTRQPPGNELSGSELAELERDQNDFRGTGSTPCGDLIAEEINTGGNSWDTTVQERYQGGSGDASHMNGAAIEATSGYYR